MTPKEFLYWLEAFLHNHDPAVSDGSYVPLLSKDISLIKQKLSIALKTTNEADKAAKFGDNTKVLLLDVADKLNQSTKTVSSMKSFVADFASGAIQTADSMMKSVEGIKEKIQTGINTQLSKPPSTPPACTIKKGNTRQNPCPHCEEYGCEKHD